MHCICSDINLEHMQLMNINAKYRTEDKRLWDKRIGLESVSTKLFVL